ncbi:MAG: type I-E CRISPR-associated protein Cas6/Cse3/CasE [Bryobacteraceae bacterium]|nr:type I-E CRISPR-associated protein Cas6/Cse3/CasE [Bryobacteraceae bacterium]
MTVITQVTVDFATAARLGLRDCYDWHQAVWKAFPRRDGEQRNFLTRLDQRREGFRLLIVSSVQPVRPDWCPRDEESWKSKPIPETFFTRTRYAFQLCANPTRKVARELPDGALTKNGRRVPLTAREELVEWIKRKGAQGGFTVVDATLRTFSRGREYFVKKGHAGLHSAVEFQGVLAVTDPVTFHETFTRGIGSAKAFGFGLLVLAPISEEPATP